MKFKTPNPFPQIGDTVLPVLWFEEGLDELGDSIVEVIDAAINGPPKYKSYVLCVLLGLAVATLVIRYLFFLNLNSNRNLFLRGKLTGWLV